jgi:hypothetical protein
MKSKTFDPIELFAQLNPISVRQLDKLAHGPEREMTSARITARRDVLSRHTRRLPRRRLAAALMIATIALAIPALAFSGVLDSLVGFSNHGTPVAEDNLSNATALALSGATSGSFVQLAARDGVGIYAARTASGNLCYFTGPMNQSDLKTTGIGGGCMNAAASAKFPSPSQPVVDLSTFEARPPDAIAHASVHRLAGVAADGVKSIEVLALADCQIVATTAVIDNVYAADNLPATAAGVIVAHDASGNAVWHESVSQGANASSCGLG